MMVNSMMSNIPVVLRVRDFRLYIAPKRRSATQGQSAAQGQLAAKQRAGRYLIDLWLNGGAAVLGHTPANLLRELKNTASRGLYAPFPHFTESRYIKALSLLFPGYSFRLYAAPTPELAELYAKNSACLWRPFVNPGSPFAIAENVAAQPPSLLVPVLPGIQGWRNELPMGLCVVAAKSENELSQLPHSERLSPILLATAARGLHNLLASPQRAKPDFPRIFKVLQNNTIWQRQGIYLTLKEPPAPGIWENLFNTFLDAGFLLPPDPSQPLILPGILSQGEETKLAGLLG
jgi:hypothetical protein